MPGENPVSALLSLCARGEALVAELLRLSGALPSLFFLAERAERQRLGIPDVEGQGSAGRDAHPESADSGDLEGAGGGNRDARAGSGDAAEGGDGERGGGEVIPTRRSARWSVS